MTPSQPMRSSDAASGLHIATIAHSGQLWDTYLHFEEDPHAPAIFRGLLRFIEAGAEGEPRVTQTAAIIIEDSYEAALDRARGFDERQLEALLRSTIPDGPAPTE